jgi:predicted dehydrogenase
MTKRRDFIRNGVLGTAGITLGGIGLRASVYESIIGSSDRINVAIVGLRSRGSNHLDEWCYLKDKQNVQVTVLCDADEQFFAERSKTVLDKTGVKPVTEWDLHKVIDNKDIHVVSFATPNHWHALGTILACQAGKNVYVEKPACHNIFEGRKMIEAARKYDVRVQVGFQARSYKNIIDAIKFLHGGGIGDVYMARGLCFKPRDSFGIAKDSVPPPTLHYDRWLGPALWREYNEKRGHYNWHWHWNTGNGDSGNQGVHEFDIARWGLNKNEHPVSVYSSGGIYGISPDECSQETPNTQSSVFKYKDGTMLEFETRGRYFNKEGNMGIGIGNIFYGTEGYLELQAWEKSGGEWQAFRKREKEPFAGSKIGEGKQLSPTLLGPDSTDHFSNFINAVRAGKDEILNSDINEGFYSSALPHLANISYRLGRELKFMGDYEKFANDSEADTMLTRNYRKPYVVPNEV